MSLAEVIEAPEADGYVIEQLVPQMSLPTMKAAGIPAADIMEYIEQLEPIMADVCTRSYGKFTPASLLKMVAEDLHQWWVVASEGELIAFVVTEVLTYPTGLKAGNVLIVAAGDPQNSKRREWFHLVGVLEEWARKEGCQHMQTLCRPGWEKALRAHGFKKTHLQMEKAL